LIVSIHQPAYLPWLGYFDKIRRSDVFVFLDTVQLKKNGFANRNRVRTASGVKWLTVPLLMKGHTEKSIGEMRINPASNWKRKHIATLAQAYRGRPHYERYAGGIERLIDGAGDSLGDFLFEMLGYFLGELDLDGRRVLRASGLGAVGSRAELLARIAGEVGADVISRGPPAGSISTPRRSGRRESRSPFRISGIPSTIRARPDSSPTWASWTRSFIWGARGWRRCWSGRAARPI
jgi:hypothetical protein